MSGTSETDQQQNEIKQCKDFNTRKQVLKSLKKNEQIHDFA